MKIVINSKEEFLNTISKKIKQTDVVLDFGCGIQPQKYIKPVVHICAEPYEQYAQHLLKNIGNKDRFFVVLKQKWDEVIKTLPNESVDTVITLDVIEHLEKETGLEILKNTIPLARKQVVIFTPYGFLPQEIPEGMKDAWGMDGMDWQKHKSGWTEDDFDSNWDLYICPEFHFFDAITNEKFKKPYGAMFAILNKKNNSTYNAYSVFRHIYSLFSYSLPLYFKSNSFIYNPILKFIYRKIILKITK